MSRPSSDPQAMQGGRGRGSSQNRGGFPDHMMRGGFGAPTPHTHSTSSAAFSISSSIYNPFATPTATSATRPAPSTSGDVTSRVVSNPFAPSPRGKTGTEPIPPASIPPAPVIPKAISNPFAPSPRTETPIPAPKAEKETTTPPTPIRPSPSFSSSSMSQLVTFTIGPPPSTQTFVIHKSFATQYSPVLHAAFNSSIIEGTTQTYALEDTSASAFSLFSQWLYTQTITSDRPYNAEFFRSLTPLWVLADKFLIPGLQNMAVDQMLKMTFCHGGVAAGMLDFVYANTGEGSQLRRLFVALCAWNVGGEDYVAREGFPQVLLDLARYFKNVQDRKLRGAMELRAAVHYVKEEAETK